MQFKIKVNVIFANLGNPFSCVIYINYLVIGNRDVRFFFVHSISLLSLTNKH